MSHPRPMAYRDPPNLPPLPTRQPPFPDQAPLATPLVELVGWWLHVECRCGYSASPPLRLLAARYGWQTPLFMCLPRLRCSACGLRPDQVLFVDNPARLTFANGGGPLARRIVIRLK